MSHSCASVSTSIAFVVCNTYSVCKDIQEIMKLVTLDVSEVGKNLGTGAVLGAKLLYLTLVLEKYSSAVDCPGLPTIIAILSCFTP